MRRALVVSVVENPVINRVAFEGNKKAKDEQLKAEVQSKPRGTLSKPTVQADVQRIIEIYHRSGRFDVSRRSEDHRTAEQPRQSGVRDQRRREDRGEGNRLRRHPRLLERPSERRDQDTESNLLSFLQTTDIYDPDRVEADRDLLRRFYLQHGYADVRIVSAVGEYDPAQEGLHRHLHDRRGRPVSHRHRRCESRTCSARSGVAARQPSSQCRATSTTPIWSRRRRGDDIEAAKHGYAFATVRPRGDRDFAEEASINVSFVVEEGTRAYIERINIRGNTRTRDYVIRREFDIGEGDAYNRALIDRAERRLKNWNYFKTVKITNEPGSAPDRVVINVNVEEQSTGEFTISGGYSTADGFLAEVSVADRNLMGRGQFAKASVSYGQYFARLRAVVCRALSAWLSHGRRRRPVRADKLWRRPTCRTTRRPSALTCASASR